MKKLVLLLLMVTVVISISGCKSATKVSTTNAKASTIISDARYGIISAFKDPDTGVWYIINAEGGITPRLNADGSLYCE